MKKIIDKVDEFGDRAIHYIYKKNKYLDKTMIWITVSGDLGIIWIIISFFLLTKEKHMKVGIMMLLSIALASILGEGILKHIVKRKRPFIRNRLIELLIAEPSTYSFPSGHTASSFAAATVFVNTNMALSSAIVVLAVLISFSRVYLRVHYLSDVIGGAILGIFCGLVVVGILG